MGSGELPATGLDFPALQVFLEKGPGEAPPSTAPHSRGGGSVAEGHPEVPLLLKDLPGPQHTSRGLGSRSPTGMPWPWRLLVFPGSHGALSPLLRVSRHHVP